MKIKKRNGQEVDFDSNKIEQAIFKALNATDSDTSYAHRLKQKVVTIIEALFDKKIPEVEDVQDVVEQVLINENLSKTAKAYILYRNQHARLRNEQHVINNYIDLVENYIGLSDWKVNENSNMGYSLQGLNNYISSHVSSIYWLHKIYDEEIAQEHLSGRIHIHDLSILSVYCCGWDLFDFLCMGLGGVPAKIESNPPKHLASALGQIVNFFYTIQGECYSEDTKVLTKAGWKFFYDTTDEDEFYTINLDNKTTEFQKRLNYIEKEYTGQLINFTSDNFNQLVTENHKMIFFDNNENKIIFKLAKDVFLENIYAYAGINQETTIFQKNKIDYSGKVYCVQVPNQTLLVSRNGKASWGSNCAGAQAFSNFDTLIAPFIRYDGLNREQVKQHLQEFIFNINVPTRVGFQCMSEDTEILTSDGWKKHFEIKVGDNIKTFNLKTKNIEDQTVNHFFSSKYNGKMYSIKNDETNQLISPKHRVVINHPNNKYDLLPIENCLTLPEIQTPILQKQDSNIKNIIIDRTHITEVVYEGTIWCPNTINETVIARRNGKIFITGNTPFTNITMDLEVPSFYKNMPVIIGGQPQKETYGDFQPEMDIFNDVFCEVMMEGDSKGRIFTFPIPTYNLTKDFNWDNLNLEKLWKITSKYGIPYFANFINSDMKPDEVRSMCCRLRLDNTELRKRGGGLFASNPMTGSIGVVTINLPRLAYISKTKENFFKEIYNCMLISRRSLKTKRNFLEKNTENGLYPYSRHYLSKIKQNNLKQYWSNHFNTIGIIGMNEACLNLLNISIATEEGKSFAIETLNFMREKLSEFQIQDDMLYNLEAAPCEGSSYSLAKMDKKQFPDIKTSGITEPYYTNSTHLPVNHTNDIFDALLHQNEIQPLYTGGTLFNGFLGEQISNPKACKELVKKIAENFNMSYFTITPTFSICPVHGYVTGEHHLCPTMSKVIK